MTRLLFPDLKPLFNLADETPIIMAGPCSAESEAQTLATAQSLAQAGIKIFRAGVWKPRTRPGGFEGIGSPALAWLRKVKSATGMLIGTEVANERHLSQAVMAGVDFIWLGARTAANPFAVQEIADALSTLPPQKLDELTVLVKNPVNPDINLWLGSLQRIYNAGIRRLGAIHRGFSSYGNHIYRNPPEWRIPIELKRRLPNLPVICDPSHIGGNRDLILPLSHRALNARFDGLIIESHCNPDEALSDAAQQVTPQQLAGMLKSLSNPADDSPSESLNSLREEIDSIDSELLELLAKRMDIAERIGEYKREKGMKVVQPNRYNQLMQKRVEQGEQLGMPADFVREILAVIHEESVRRQLDICS